MFRTHEPQDRKPDECGFCGCRRAATVFYFTPKGWKYWYCTEHYDRMAAHYVKTATTKNELGIDESWSHEMVTVNGW